MARTPLVKPIGEAGVGEVLVCQDSSMGKEFGMKTRNRVMALQEAMELLGPTVLNQFADSLDWEQLEHIGGKKLV
jgi:hypothetical protein